MSIFNCNLKYTRIESNSLQSTKNKFIVNGFIDKYNNILNLPKFRIANTETSEQASSFLGKKVRVFSEETGGNKALPMFEVFKEINKTKIINKTRKEKSERLERERFQEEARLKQLREGYDGKDNINEDERLNIAKEINRELLQSSKGRSSSRLQSGDRSPVEIQSNKDFFSIRDSFQERTLSEAQKATQDGVFEVGSNNSILSVIRQKLSDTNTLNGRLFAKLNTLDKIKCIITKNGDSIYVVGNNLYINPESLNNHLAETDGENYLNSLIFEELVHLVSNTLIPKSKESSIIDAQIDADPNFVNKVNEIYPTSNNRQAYFEYIRIKVQEAITSTTTLKERMVWTEELLNIYKELMEFISDVIQTNTTKKLIKEHIKFIKPLLDKNNLNASELINELNLTPNEKSNYNPNQTFSELLQEVASFNTSHIKGINFAKLDSVIQYEKERDNFNWITRGQRSLELFSNSSYYRGLMEKTFEEVSTNKGGNLVDSLYYTLYNIAKITSTPDSFFERLKNNYKNREGKSLFNKIQINIIGLGEAIYFDTSSKNIVINLETLVTKLLNNISDTQEKYDRLERILTEEYIHAISTGLLTETEENIIFNELSEKEKTSIKTLYSKVTTKKQLVHEYLRMVVQQKRFGEITEYGKRTVQNILKKALNYIIKAFDNKSINSVTKQTVNSILNIIKDSKNINNSQKQISHEQAVKTFTNDIFATNQRPLSTKGRRDTSKYSSTVLARPTKLGEGVLVSSLQQKFVGKSFKEAWDNTGGNRVQKRNVLLWSLQQRFEATDTFNGGLSDKLHKQGKINYYIDANSKNFAVSKPLNLIDTFYKPGDIVFNLDLFIDAIETRGNFDIDKYIDRIISEELIHSVTTQLFTDEKLNNVYKEQFNDIENVKKLNELYPGISNQPIRQYYEYIRMGVQNYFFEDSSELVGNTKIDNNPLIGLLEDWVMGVWNYIKETFNKPYTKQVIDEHIKFISLKKTSNNVQYTLTKEELYAPFDIDTELNNYNNTEELWGIADSYQEYKDFKDKNKDLALEQLIIKFTKYKTEKELEGRENTNLDCL